MKNFSISFIFITFAPKPCIYYKYDTQHSFYPPLWGSLAGLLILLLVLSCSEDKSSDPPHIDPNPVENSDIDFSIASDDGGTSGPIVAEDGKTASVSITQKSSYTDTNGEVFVCEPKATIKLCTQIDTIYAKDLADLTKIGETQVSSSKSGTNPVKHLTTQEFNIGSQKVEFELTHEIYQYVNAASQTIEMPYVKPNNAKMGDNSVDNGAKKSRAKNAINPVISVRPLSQPRGITVTDTTLYEVEVKFEVEVEAKNSANAQSKTLDFEVKYVAAVENVTELPDPTSGIDYSIEGANGKTSFDVTKTGLTLEFIQKSQYTDSYGSVFSVEPKASIGVKYTLDTLRVNHIDSLYVIKTGDVSKESVGDNPVTHKLGQKFNSFEQEILFDIAYEAYVANDIEMPYLKINPATLKSEITVSPIEGNTRAVVITKELYDVCVKFSVEVETQNADENTSKTLEFGINYVGEVTTEEVVPDPEPELVDVKYRKELSYVAEHDGLPASYGFVLYRDRIYDDGAVRTDEFYSGQFMWSMRTSNNTPTGANGVYNSYAEGMYYWGNDSIYAHKGYRVPHPSKITDNFHRSIAVDSLKFVKFGEKSLNLTVATEYYVHKNYEENVSISDFEIKDDASAGIITETNLQNGWYFGSTEYSYQCYLKYANNLNSFLGIRFHTYFDDLFLVVDKKRINFKELWPKVTAGATFDEELEPDEANGRGRAKILRSHITYDFQGNIVTSEVCDTIYERLPKDVDVLP